MRGDNKRSRVEIFSVLHICKCVITQDGVISTCVIAISRFLARAWDLVALVCSMCTRVYNVLITRVSGTSRKCLGHVRYRTCLTICIGLAHVRVKTRFSHGF